MFSALGVIPTPQKGKFYSGYGLLEYQTPKIAMLKVFTHDRLNQGTQFLFLSVHHTNLEKHVLKSVFSGGSTQAYAAHKLLKLLDISWAEQEGSAAEPQPPFPGKSTDPQEKRALL